MPTIDAARLDNVARRMLAAAGTPDDIAQCVAESLVEANLKGVDSHGVMQLPVYLGDIERGAAKPAARPTTERETPVTAVVRGNGGLGIYVLHRATELAIAKARACHAASVGVIDCSHFGPVTLSVPRARLFDAAGGDREWKNQTLPAFKRRTKQAEAVIASSYLAGVNTRRVRRALESLFGGVIGKDTVSRAWRKVHSAWQAWQRRDLSGEDIVRLILDGTCVKVRLDRKATSISILVALGVRRDGQKVLLAIRNMGGESEAAWRAVLDDLVACNLATPKLLIVDGAAGLEAAIAALWPGVPVQRCTVHKERNLLAPAPKALHEEIKADHSDMMYAKTAGEAIAKRKAFLKKWRLRCRGIANGLEEAGDRLFTFLRYPPSQWKSLRTTNAIERLHEEFKRRIKTQCVLPTAETAAMLFWALLACGQITLRRVDGWDTLQVEPDQEPLDLAPEAKEDQIQEPRRQQFPPTSRHDHAVAVPQELLSLWDDVALQWAREVSEHPAVVEKVARYVAIHRELKSEPRGPRRSALAREYFALKTTLMPVAFVVMG